MRKALVAFLSAFLLTACSNHTPPQGRWEGTYEGPTSMVVSRVEIGSKGSIRISAPNAENVGSDENDRATMRQSLAAGLAAGWDEVEPRKMDFDGSTFRKPGGIAPQMVWKADKKQMTLVVYLGKDPGLYIPLRSVSDFSDNPWPQ